jgi:hypothetical protein
MGMDKIKNFFNKPRYFHGLLSGLIILASKFVFYTTQHWEYAFNPSFPFFTFLLMLGGIIMASIAERQMRETYHYKHALATAMGVIFVAVFVSALADQILYLLIDGSLADQTKAIQMEVYIETLKTNQFISETTKDNMVEDLRKSVPESWLTFFSNVFSKTFVNGFLALIIALFTRVRQPKNQWLNE